VLQNLPTFVSFALTRTLGLIAVPLATASNALKLAQEEIPSVALKHTLPCSENSFSENESQ
jgi:hypothetical protein